VREELVLKRSGILRSRKGPNNHRESLLIGIEFGDGGTGSRGGKMSAVWKKLHGLSNGQRKEEGEC